MVSRIDRLFILLDTGSTESIRFAAAKQLGAVQKANPENLSQLLNKIKDYSHKPSWDTRLAAGQATKCVLENIESWPKTKLSINEKHIQHWDKIATAIKDNININEILDDANLYRILKTGKKLTSGALQEDSSDNNGKASTSKQRHKKKHKRNDKKYAKERNESLLRQRKLLNKQLGIDMVDRLNLGVKSTDIISNDDLQNSLDSDTSQESITKNFSQDEANNCSISKNVSNYSNAINYLLEYDADQDISKEKINPVWPLDDVSRSYINELFDSSWEVRHGAAISLREIVKLHGRSLGRRSDQNDHVNNLLNQIWLVDLALYSICVLSLDKFADFLFDQVVAPVRENISQLLSCCMMYMNEETIRSVIRLIQKMLQHPDWESRHGAVLALKYSLSVLPKHLVKDVLLENYDLMLTCLNDTVDDVGAETAAMLASVKDLLLEAVPEKIPSLVNFLWSNLENLDDLNSSTSNVVLLLTNLVTSAKIPLSQKEISRYLPILWSKYNNSSMLVKTSVLKAILTLLKALPENCATWMDSQLFRDTLSLTFQKSLVEQSGDLLEYFKMIWMRLLNIENSRADFGTKESYNILKATSQHLNYWFCLLMQSRSVPIDTSNKLWLKELNSNADAKIYIASSTLDDSSQETSVAITKCRMMGSELLGALYALLTDKNTDSEPSKETLKYLCDMFTYYLKSTSAVQKMVSCWVLESWALYLLALLKGECDILTDFLSDSLKEQFRSSIKETSLYYDEVASVLTHLQQNTRDYIQVLQLCGFSEKLVGVLPTHHNGKTFYALNHIKVLCSLEINEDETRVKKYSPTKKVRTDSYRLTRDDEHVNQLLTKKNQLQKHFEEAVLSQKALSISVLSSLVTAMISWRLTPEVDDLYIQPLIESIKMEPDPVLLRRSAVYIVKLIDIFLEDKTKYEPSINKIVSRLIDLISQTTMLNHAKQKDETNEHDILLLSNIHSSYEDNKILKSICKDKNIQITEFNDNNRYTGVVVVLEEIVQRFSTDLATKLPTFWNKLDFSDIDESKKEQDLLVCLKIFKVVWTCSKESQRNKLVGSFSNLVGILSSKNPSVRHLCCLCIGAMVKDATDTLLHRVTKDIFKLLEDSQNSHGRCGAIESIGSIMISMNLELVPHIHSFVIPILGRLSDKIDHVRLTAAECLARLLSLLPLNSKIAKPNSITEEESDNFLAELLDPNHLKDCQIVPDMKVTLRPYQQQGVNWLNFLNKYNLHGILCDEMGLGKTLMTICVLSLSHEKQSQCSNDNRYIPSLIICPTSLTTHWYEEINKFVGNDARILNPLIHYGGDRVCFHSEFQKNYRLIPQTLIASYDTIRSDIEYFEKFEWNYCVLDEGHVIKNGKTKLSKAVKRIDAKHRLILSGTPIQNNVTELWSLFDFLMPGFLGSESQFISRYARPIIQSRDLKCSSREKESGVLAMESLHRQVLPFILRRLKKDVLKDLPPKIIQDYPCELSALQLELYEDFTKGKLQNKLAEHEEVAKKEKNDSEMKDKTKKLKSQILQALRYLRNVCNHPKMVLDSKHPEFNRVNGHLQKTNSNLNDISHSSKLKALMQLLQDCGIGSESDANQATASASSSNDTTSSEIQRLELSTAHVVNNHRALIFCQTKAFIDIIEQDLFKQHMPSITYLRLDGSVPSMSRQAIVNRFNTDPSIDVLLLTTYIGGLGLNLHTADTVIFVEHDWNPTRDLQAMDRAHRIGQKKVVNVFRLITKNTIEEKIMNLQQFKTMVSETVISAENSDIKTMKTDTLLDLFNTQPTNIRHPVSQTASYLELLPELWSEQDYEAEYDLNKFKATLTDDSG